jgi:uncharacterized membrane protein
VKWTSGERAIWIASAAFAAIYCALGAWRYETYSSGSDLGLFTQSLSAAFSGFANTTEGGSHFTYHFSPILYLCAPIVIATHSALALVAIGAIACALAAPPLFYIARKRMPERLAFAVACVALLYPPLAGVAFADFHENVFAPAATLWLLWALDARRFRMALAFVLVTLAIKEDQAVILGALALGGVAHYGLRRDRTGALFSVTTFVLAAAAFAFFFEVVRPLAGARDVWGPTHFYTWSRIVDPRGSAPWYSIGRPAYFLEAMVPLAFACFVTPAFALVLPGFVEVLLSHESITYTMGQHYAGVWIGYALFAFALGIASLYRRSPRLGTNFVRVALFCCVAILAFASPTHWGHYLHARTAHDAALDRALANLPPNLDVGTFDAAYAHLGFDPNAYLGLDRAPRYALLDAHATTIALVEKWRPIVRSGLADGTYRLLAYDDGVELYERCRGARDKSPKASRDAGC